MSSRSTGDAESMEVSLSERQSAPIGAFDSGYGGLTVLKEIARLMPAEDTLFVGDSSFFPYGPKSLKDVRSRVLGICSYLVERGCKIIVIACNTATAAGLKDAQREFGVPIIGVVEPGSRAAVYVTHSRKVGIIATQGTVNSGAYVDAIQNLDAGIEVMQKATPELVDFAEAGIQLDSDGSVASSDMTERLRGSLSPMLDRGIDTLVLGCTHFPLVEDIIQDCVGPDVTLVSSAEETAREVKGILYRQGLLRPVRSAASGEHDRQSFVDLNGIPDVDAGSDGVFRNIVESGRRTFITTSGDVDGFKTFALRVIGKVLAGYEPVFEHAEISGR